jgi:hypothetical protein
VLHRLCQIGYPPHPDATTKAHKAAFVLMLKDRLNGLATPARGITIAYTAMFITENESHSILPWRNAPAASPLRSARRDLASQAYPGLEPHARFFSKVFRKFPWLMLVMLILTASAYWDVGFGRIIVQRIEQLDKQRGDLLYPDRQGTPTAQSVNEAGCDDGTSLSADQIQACGKLHHLQQSIAEARADLFNFAVAARGGQDRWSLLHLIDWTRPIRYGFMFNGQMPLEARPEASVAWVLSLFSTYVLPAMFGLLGTLAATMRSIQAKVRDSLLGPRDYALSVLGLAVGPIAGLAVGLYFTPTGATAAGTTGLAGAVSLSASGLGFLAGYGADAFFKFVDALLGRVFSFDHCAK